MKPLDLVRWWFWLRVESLVLWLMTRGADVHACIQVRLAALPPREEEDDIPF